MKKVLIIGLGSIGERHAKALLQINNVDIAAYRTKKGNKKIDASLNKKIKHFYFEEEVNTWNPSHIIISNPTSLHIKYIKKYINSNSSIFVEKPIANNLQELNDLNIITKGNIFVGYNLRFHKIIQTIKSSLVNNKYGSTIAAELNVGHYLPSWHPYEDYRIGYAARKELGGGVLRTLSHEIDLVQFFFGEVKSIFAKVNKLSNLEINADDYTTLIVKQISVNR